MPVAAIALTIGMKPLCNAWRTTGRIAHRNVSPSMSWASIDPASRRIVAVSVCRPRLMPVIALPRIMPNSGIAKCGAYHGSGRIGPASAKAVTRNPAVIAVSVPRA